MIRTVYDGFVLTKRGPTLCVSPLLRSQKRRFGKRPFQLGTERVGVKREAVIVRMCSVHGASVLVGAAKDRCAVDVIHIAVAVLPRVAVGVENDIPARKILRVGTVKVDAGDHEIGDLWVRGADCTVEFAVRVAQVLRVRRVVVIIRDESAHIERSKVVDHRILRLPAARKTEVDVIQSRAARDDVLVAVSGARGATALRDGTAVVDDGRAVAVAKPLADRCIVPRADQERIDPCVEREIDGDVPQISRGKTDRCLVAVRNVKRRHKGAEIAGGSRCGIIDIEVKSCGACERDVRHFADAVHGGMDGDQVGIGGEANPPACCIIGKLGNARADRCGNRFGHPTKGNRIFIVVKPVDGKGGLPHIVPCDIRVGHCFRNMKICVDFIQRKLFHSGNSFLFWQFWQYGIAARQKYKVIATGETVRYTPPDAFMLSAFPLYFITPTPKSQYFFQKAKQEGRAEVAMCGAFSAGNLLFRYRNGSAHQGGFWNMIMRNYDIAKCGRQHFFVVCNTI